MCSVTGSCSSLLACTAHKLKRSDCCNSFLSHSCLLVHGRHVQSSAAHPFVPLHRWPTASAGRCSTSRAPGTPAPARSTPTRPGAEACPTPLWAWCRPRSTIPAQSPRTATSRCLPQVQHLCLPMQTLAADFVRTSVMSAAVIRSFVCLPLSVAAGEGPGLGCLDHARQCHSQSCR